jgi:hypothetical protein
LTEQIIGIVLGAITILIGYRYYGYVVRNFPPNDERSKNLSKAVIIFLTGFMLLILAFIGFFSKSEM